MVTQVKPGHDLDDIKEAFAEHLAPLLQAMDVTKFGAVGGGGQWTLTAYIETDMTITVFGKDYGDKLTDVTGTYE